MPENVIREGFAGAVDRRRDVHERQRLKRGLSVANRAVRRCRLWASLVVVPRIVTIAEKLFSSGSISAIERSEVQADHVPGSESIG